MSLLVTETHGDLNIHLMLMALMENNAGPDFLLPKSKMAQCHPKGIKLIRIKLSLNISSMNRISLSQSFRLNFAIKMQTANMYKQGQAKRPNIVRQTVLFLNLHGQVFCIKNKRTHKKHCLYRRKV